MPERPVECGHCKKPVKVIYKEITGNSIMITEMCSDCPILEQKLHGTIASETVVGDVKAQETGLACGNCRTLLESVKMGNPLGCSNCYTVFGDVIISELIEEQKIPSSLKKGLTVRKNQPIHIGKSPGKQVSLPTSNRLTELNVALNEALKKENYEEAAGLRDQIKALMEKKDESKS
ncbi:MAG TPA: UvrB/UvrC motif-containing protein [Rhabdochlamydiaceae bacterium]|nr:UvrB/UvrC motif-containing protein [Rhabdochlamydiaceae bacterium]